MSSSFKRRGKKASVRPVARPVSGSPSTSTVASPSDGPSSSLLPPSIKGEQQQSKSINNNNNSSSSLSSSLLAGTKPWTNNLTLTSFGLREIDSFFFSSGSGSSNDSGGGGGQPLQTLVVLEEDRLSDDLARALCRYWCGEGVAQRQMVLMGSCLLGAETSLELLDEAAEAVGGNDVADGDSNEGSTPQELGDFVKSLPRNLHLDKFREKANKLKQKNQSSDDNSKSGNNQNNTDAAGNHNILSSNREAISAIIEEDEEEDEDEHNHDSSQNSRSKDEGLINAWQYRKSVQDARSGMGNQKSQSSGNGSAAGNDGIYCHSYDLSKRMWDQFDSAQGEGADDENPLVVNTKIIDCSSQTGTVTSSGKNHHQQQNKQQQGLALFCKLWKHLQSTLSTHPNTVIRLFLHRLPIGLGAVAMPLLMAKIRKENLPVVVLSTIRPWRYLTSPTSSHNNKLDTLASLRTASDVTLSLDSFSSLRSPPPPEFSLLQGILTVRKCASFTSASHYTDSVAFKRPLAERFGVKRDGRKVLVQLLHLPPEEYSKGGSSTGGVRSGGGNVVNAAAKDKATSGVVGSGGGGNNSSKKVGGCSSLGGGASLDF